jgi:hypothetical protein
VFEHSSYHHDMKIHEQYQTHHHDMKIHVNIHEQYQHDIYKKSQSSIKIDRKSNPTPS